MKPLDLKVDDPEKVPEVLRAAADFYIETADKLVINTCRDEAQRKRWKRVARILHLTANRVEEALE